MFIPFILLYRWLLHAWEILAARVDYLEHAWTKCGMGQLTDPEFQRNAVSLVLEKKLVSEKNIKKFIDVVNRTTRVQEREAFVPDCHADIDLTPTEVMENIERGLEANPSEQELETEVESSADHPPKVSMQHYLSNLTNM
jgi:hypothetical protein